MTRGPRRSKLLRLTTPALVATAVIALPACKGDKAEDDDEAKPSGERSVEPEPELPKDAPAGPFAGYDFDAAKQRWQGAWVLPGSVPGKTLAWEVAGDAVTVFDGEDSKRFDFAIYSPCQVTFTDAEAGETTYKSFVFAGDTLHTGLGSAGMVLPASEGKGERTVVCAGGKVYVLDDEGCGEWSEIFDDWKREDGECRIEGEGEERRFVAGSSKLEFIAADALATAQMKANVARKFDDLEAAKAALGDDAG